MKSDKRLREIEKSLSKFRTREYSDIVCDIDWLIARVASTIIPHLKMVTMRNESEQDNG